MSESITIHRRVQFSETDMAGIVHFSNFFKWMEDAESAFFKKQGLDLIKKEGNSGIIRGFPRLQAECNFKKPLKFDDEFSVTISVLEVRNHSIRFGFSFHKLDGNDEVANGKMTTVYGKFDTLNDTLEAALLPEDMLEKLRKW